MKSKMRSVFTDLILLCASLLADLGGSSARACGEHLPAEDDAPEAAAEIEEEAADSEVQIVAGATKSLNGWVCPQSSCSWW